MNRLPITYGDRQVVQPVRGVNVAYAVMRNERPARAGAAG